MRKSPTKDIEQYRITAPLSPLMTTKKDGAIGAFRIPFRKYGPLLDVIVSDGRDWEECGFEDPAWEHVSVSLPSRCPNWEEMEFIKRIFWRDDELVVQFHVPREDHVNHHPFCLHLWKPIGFDIPRPPASTVGPKTRSISF